jgi:hypothetical protein
MRQHRKDVQNPSRSDRFQRSGADHSSFISRRTVIPSRSNITSAGISHGSKIALSDKTKRFLRTIKGKMRVIVFFSPSTPITADVKSAD